MFISLSYTQQLCEQSVYIFPQQVYQITRENIKAILQYRTLFKRLLALSNATGKEMWSEIYYGCQGSGCSTVFFKSVPKRICEDRAFTKGQERLPPFIKSLGRYFQKERNGNDTGRDSE
ncbi:hypothetical protein AVEN_239686-1 [Araneus ventricosus]|uniref:Uncharacterized protein n=1 Tax=Araneus ventricosus TaxID=182803 RepID=A0A4Y2CTH2_ARAVE|nr:hypothetical protein AVEN_239686-1 [Araneus ventricosus]